MCCRASVVVVSANRKELADGDGSFDFAQATATISASLIVAGGQCVGCFLIVTIAWAVLGLTAADRRTLLVHTLSRCIVLAAAVAVKVPGATGVLVGPTVIATVAHIVVLTAVVVCGFGKAARAENALSQALNNPLLSLRASASKASDRPARALVHRTAGPQPSTVKAIAMSIGGDGAGDSVPVWLSARDTSSHRVYYHNRVTGAIAWDVPAGFAEITDWVRVDSSGGPSYYLSPSTSLTSMDVPVGYRGLVSVPDDVAHGHSLGHSHDGRGVGVSGAGSADGAPTASSDGWAAGRGARAAVATMAAAADGADDHQRGDADVVQRHGQAVPLRQQQQQQQHSHDRGRMHDGSQQPSHAQEQRAHSPSRDDAEVDEADRRHDSAPPSRSPLPESAQAMQGGVDDGFVATPSTMASALEVARRRSQVAATSPAAKDRVFFQELKKSKAEQERIALEAKLAAMSVEEREAYELYVPCTRAALAHPPCLL
jgi:hypothetical protein